MNRPSTKVWGRRCGVRRVEVGSLRKLRELQRAFSKELRFYRLILRHERTPRIARLFLGAALAYALSPIDLVPDWIPVLGHLDDVLVVPLLVWCGLKFVPVAVVAECRARV